MKKILAILLCVLMLFSGVVPSFATESENKENSKKNYLPNEVILMQKCSYSSSGLYSAKSEYSLPFISSEIIDTTAIDENAHSSPRKNYSVNSTVSETRIIKGTVEYGTDIEKLCKTLEKRDDIISADPNYIQTADSISIPTEAQQSGSSYNGFNWYKDSLNLTDAWQSADTLGSRDVVVAVIDTGVNVYHKELADNLWDDGNGNHGWNAVDDNYDVSDTNGHGSNVAGIIAMGADNGGYVGISPEVSIMALKASTGANIADSDILECLNFAVENGADIVNMSFGGSSISSTMATEYQKAARKTVLIAAAGNSSYSTENILQFPAAYNGVIGVMSYGSYKDSDMTNYTIDNGELSSFSNYDPSGKYYEVSAPGVKIIGLSQNKNDEYSYKTGTSQATPIVAGTAALYLSLYPDASPYQVRNAIIDGSDESVNGYFDNNTYKRINIKNILEQSPKEDKKLSLSDNAISVLNSCFDENFSGVYASDLDALNIILPKNVTPIRADISALSELNTALIIDISSLGITNDKLSWFQNASFPKLFNLNIDTNLSLSKLYATENTAPMLLELHCENCAFDNAEEFSVFSKLRSLYANTNKFKTSESFSSLTSLFTLNLTSCLLQDANGFKSLDNLQSLDISENFINDISPLQNYEGSYLDISSNPLNLGVGNDLQIKSIKSFMNNNSFSYSSINFYYYSLNGDESVEYVPSQSISFKENYVPRSAETATVSAEIEPKNANVNSFCTYSSGDENVEINKYTGKISWKKDEILTSKKVKINVHPTSGYPDFDGVLNITAPEIYEFSYSDSGYTLRASCATESVKIGNTVLTDYTEENSFRYFSVPENIIYSETLSAVPSDSLGNGKQFLIGTADQSQKKAEIISFYSDSETPSSGDTATFSVKTNVDTNYVKIKNCRNSNTFILSDFTEQNGYRIFSFKQKFSVAGKYKYKAYGSADGNFKIGATVISLDVLQAVNKITLSNNNGGNLYFSENNNTANLSVSFYPQNAKTGKNITFSSSKESVASVSADGTVTAKGYGTALIKAENENGLSAFTAISVTKPLISDIDVSAENVGEESTFEVYTDGADNIKLCNSDNSDVNYSYTATKRESGIEGYDTKWQIKATINTFATQNIKIYALDNKGEDEKKDNFSSTSFTCTNPMNDFELTSDRDTYNRNDGAVRVYLKRTPLDSNATVTWSASTNTIASLSKSANYCTLIPKASGTLTVSATATINGESVTKTKEITFTESKIYEAKLSTLSPVPYTAFTVSVKTDKDMKYIHLYDCTNLLGTEYSDACYYNDDGDYRLWTLPFFTKNTSSQIRVWGGDKIGNISEAKYIDISSTMPTETTLASSNAYYCGNVGESAPFSAVILPARTSVSESELSIKIENPEIAKYENGTITYLKHGNTSLTCTYNGQSVNIPISVYAPIKEIGLPYSELTLYTGTSYELTPTISPADYTDELTYSSSNKSVFTVDENGNIKGISKGDAVLTLTSKSGIKAEMAVRVRANAFLQSMKFEKSEYSASVGNTITPNLVTDKSDYLDHIHYEISNTNILSDLGLGRFKANKEGTVTLKAFSDYGLEATTTITIGADKRFSLNRQYIECAVNSVVSLATIISPSGVDFDGSLYSDNTQVATVTSGGYIYTKTAGTCNIIYIAENGESVSCKLKVNGANITRISLEEFENDTLNLGVNDSHIIDYSLTPKYATEDIKWVSSNENIAKVDQNGFVTGISVGTTTISATIASGKSYSFPVEVSANTFSISGTVACSSVLTLTDISGNKENYNINGNFTVENIKKGTYTAEISSLHRTKEIINEFFVNEDTFIDSITLYNGDVNGDGSVDVSDISIILQNGIYSSSAENKENCDVNDDGQINVSDIAIILLTENYSKQGINIIF